MEGKKCLLHTRELSPGVQGDFLAICLFILQIYTAHLSEFNRVLGNLCSVKGEGQ